jgi:hypothetical protein
MFCLWPIQESAFPSNAFDKLVDGEEHIISPSSSAVCKQLLAAAYHHLSIRKLPSNVVCTAIDQRGWKVFCLLLSM